MFFKRLSRSFGSGGGFNFGFGDFSACFTERHTEELKEFASLVIGQSASIDADVHADSCSGPMGNTRANRGCRVAASTTTSTEIF
jgi:hypothetical protein